MVVEFRGTMYHVMARGDRREKIVRDDGDRRTFFRTLDAACERAGFRVHAYVLMSNHYHLLLETPEANLSLGMGWLQNAFTRRFNVRHGLWGHEDFRRERRGVRTGIREGKCGIIPRRRPVDCWKPG